MTPYTDAENYDALSDEAAVSVDEFGLPVRLDEFRARFLQDVAHQRAAARVHDGDSGPGSSDSARSATPPPDAARASDTPDVDAAPTAGRGA